MQQKALFVRSSSCIFLCFPLYPSVLLSPFFWGERILLLYLSLPPVKWMLQPLAAQVSPKELLPYQVQLLEAVITIQAAGCQFLS